MTEFTREKMINVFLFFGNLQPSCGDPEWQENGQFLSEEVGLASTTRCNELQKLHQTSTTAIPTFICICLICLNIYRKRTKRWFNPPLGFTPGNYFNFRKHLDDVSYRYITHVLRDGCGPIPYVM